jgi:hypothetical protein
MESLTNAESQLTDLYEQRESLQADLAAAVEAADAPNMIALQDKIDRVAVYIYAQRAKILRLQKSQDTLERSIAITEREALEVQLVLATQDYARAVVVADDKRVAMQLIQVKLYGKDSLIESYREKIADETAELRSHIANWKTLSLLPASERAA